MKQLLIFLFTVLLTLPLPIACNYTSYVTEFKVESIEVAMGAVENENSFYRLRPVGLTDSVLSVNFGISFEADSLSPIDNQSIVSKFSTPFFQYSLADPVPPTSSSEIALISIYPTDTLHTLTHGSFSPEETLSNLFTITSNYESHSKSSILSFLESYTRWYVDDYLILHMEAQVASSYIGSFVIQITLSDGTIISAETASIHLY